MILASTCAAAFGDLCEPQWSANVGAGDFGMVVSLASLDDGESISHYIASSGVAQWTGEAWTMLGDEQLFAVRALTVFDDGDGPALYAGPEVAFLESGSHSGVVRWDGTKWLAVGASIGTLSTLVHDLIVFDNGTGPALYAGGFFGGGPAEGISRWDGRTWSPLTGMTGTLTATIIRASAAFDDGSGPALYVGGNQLAVNGEPTSIAKWDGTNWSAIPGMPQANNTIVTAITVHDDGSGPALYVGGFSSPDPFQPVVVSRFDGEGWSVVATPLNASIQALANFDDGSGFGPALYVGGNFFETITESGNQPLSRIARLNGNEWEQLNNGTSTGVFALRPSVDILDGQTPALHVGGNFSTAYGIASANFAQWRGCDVLICIAADLNCDGSVGVPDLLILLANWGACDDPDDCIADLDGNGNVGVSDLLILLANWG